MRLDIVNHQLSSTVQTQVISVCFGGSENKNKNKKNTQINLVKRFVVYLFESVMDLESLVDLVLVGLKPWLASD